jgi:hypothetical protein
MIANPGRNAPRERKRMSANRERDRMEKSADEIKLERDAHHWSKWFATWRLCENAACARARACRGNGRACLKAKFPLLPEGVRDWFMGYLWHKQEQFPFEDMFDNLESSGLNQALRDWYAEGSAGRTSGAA